MRTTVDLDADLLERLRLEATRRRQSFKDLLNAVIRSGLAATSSRRQVPYSIPALRLGAVREGIDLDRALRLSDALEDAEISDEIRRGR